jgi:hypothetical protein
MKEQIQKHARKHIKDGCYLKVTLGHRGLSSVVFAYSTPSPVKVFLIWGVSHLDSYLGSSVVHKPVVCCVWLENAEHSVSEAQPRLFFGGN